MKELTQKQIDRQDFVDNEILDLLKRLLPQNTSLDWDIEIIATVRETIRIQLTDKGLITSEQRFYPYIKI